MALAGREPVRCFTADLGETMPMTPCINCGMVANSELGACPGCGLVRFWMPQPQNEWGFSKCHSCGQAVPWKVPPEVCPQASCQKRWPLKAKYKQLTVERAVVVFLSRNWFWLVPLWMVIVLRRSVLVGNTSAGNILQFCNSALRRLFVMRSIGA